MPLKCGDTQMPGQWGLGNSLRHPEVSNSSLLEATKAFCQRHQLGTDVSHPAVKQHPSLVGWSFEVCSNAALCCVP